MLNKFKLFLERILNIRPKIVIITFTSLAFLISFSIFLFTSVIYPCSNEDYDILENKITDMINCKDFKKYEDIIVNKCEHNLISDSLTVEAKYKKASIIARVSSYSSSKCYIKAEHPHDLNNSSLLVVILSCLTIGVICSLVIFLAIIFLLDFLLKILT